MSTLETFDAVATTLISFFVIEMSCKLIVKFAFSKTRSQLCYLILVEFQASLRKLLEDIWYLIIQHATYKNG